MFLSIASTVNNWIYGGLYAVYIITVISTVIVVISENRNPVKTIAWVVVLLFLPVAGIVFYFFFGQDFTRHRMISRKSLKKLHKKSEYTDVDNELQHMPEEVRQLVQLAYSTGQSVLYSGNEVTVYTNGQDKFDALKSELRKAESFIHIQYYIIDNDNIGNEIKQILMDKARAGVEVRLIYDDVGCWNTKKRFFEEMKKVGIQVYPFLEVTFPRLANKINYRNHRKIVVIDGKVGFMGGMNIADRYKGLSWGVWRDTHLMIKGPGVQGLQSAFSVDWHFTARTLLSQSRYFPLVDPCGDTNLQVITSGPIGEWAEIAFGIFKAIASAKHTVYIQTPYFLPTESLLKALQSAALSKVDVRLMLPARSDSLILNLATCSYITPMLKAGVKIYFYLPGFLHAKVVQVDNCISIVGSSNLDFRSFEHNFEVNSFMYDEALAGTMKSIFLQDQKDCRRITIRGWRSRPFRRKIAESVVRLLSPLL